MITKYKVTLVTRGHTHHMWPYLSHVVALVTSGHIVTSGQVVTCGHIVTCGVISHIWSHKVTLVTTGHTYHDKPILQMLTKK